MCVKEKRSKTVSFAPLYTPDNVILRDTVLRYHHCYYYIRQASGEYRRLQTTAENGVQLVSRKNRFIGRFNADFSSKRYWQKK